MRTNKPVTAEDVLRELNTKFAIIGVEFSDGGELQAEDGEKWRHQFVAGAIRMLVALVRHEGINIIQGQCYKSDNSVGRRIGRTKANYFASAMFGQVKGYSKSES